MHEFSVVDRIVKTVLDQLQDQRVTQPERIGSIFIKMGFLDIHGHASFIDLFETRTKGTLLETKPLKLELVPPRLHCSGCGFEGPIPHEQLDCHVSLPLATCPGCGLESPVTGGKGLETVQVVLNDPFRASATKN